MSRLFSFFSRHRSFVIRTLAFTWIRIAPAAPSQRPFDPISPSSLRSPPGRNRNSVFSKTYLKTKESCCLVPPIVKRSDSLREVPAALVLNSEAYMNDKVRKTLGGMSTASLILAGSLPVLGQYIPDPPPCPTRSKTKQNDSAKTAKTKEKEAAKKQVEKSPPPAKTTDAKTAK
jgi:hypothetical protein